jgi:hypothetical protein
MEKDRQGATGAYFANNTDGAVTAADVTDR